MTTRPRSTNFSSECENELNLRNFLGRILFSLAAIASTHTIFEFYQSAVNTIRTNTIADYRLRIQIEKKIKKESFIMAEKDWTIKQLAAEFMAMILFVWIGTGAAVSTNFWAEGGGAEPG